MKRLNITLPEEIASKIENFPNKSRFIAHAVQEKLERIKKEKLEELLREGYQATSQEDKRTNEEWEPISLEGWE